MKELNRGVILTGGHGRRGQGHVGGSAGEREERTPHFVRADILQDAAPSGGASVLRSDPRMPEPGQRRRKSMSEAGQSQLRPARSSGSARPISSSMSASEHHERLRSAGRERESETRVSARSCQLERGACWARSAAAVGRPLCGSWEGEGRCHGFKLRSASW